MTYEEAHKFLEVKQREMTMNRHLYNKQATEINGLAILALEKQMPKKCTDVFHTEKYIDGRCPVCYSRQSQGDIEWKRKFNKYCRNCGQALDWSDTK